MSECAHDYDNAIRKGRAHYVCPLCETDISFVYILIGIAELDKEVEHD